MDESFEDLHNLNDYFELYLKLNSSKQDFVAETYLCHLQGLVAVENYNCLKDNQFAVVVADVAVAVADVDVADVADVVDDVDDVDDYYYLKNDDYF